ncbi:hypothetical protein FBU59_003730 [Linderina macrospora]|uniref:Uncharacterized protein n=1 Tax=Linderina macrospora TaxID=4868 RepID=A0ACC1J7J5_9FUNG|nr:hypothetical protein FBU59_003730 [Linderina macrospora]
MNSPSLHPAIQKRIDAYTDLIPAPLHSMWGSNDAQVVNRFHDEGFMHSHKQFFSPLQERLVGMWNFSRDTLPADMVVSDTTLFTLADDMAGEFSEWIAKHRSQNDASIRFTVNLKVTKTGASPTGRSFFFEAKIESSSQNTLTVGAVVYDAENNTQIIDVRGVFVTVPVAKTGIMNKSAVEQAITVPSPLLSALDAESLKPADISDLCSVMNFLPNGAVRTRAGSFSRSERSIATVLDFGPKLTGPVIYVHGGILGTVLYIASGKLVQLLTGKTIDAVHWDITYKSPMPMESTGNVIRAHVESESASSIAVFAKIMRGDKVHTTLKSVFSLKTLAIEPSKL